MANRSPLPPLSSFRGKHTTQLSQRIFSPGRPSTPETTHGNRTGWVEPGPRSITGPSKLYMKGLCRYRPHSYSGEVGDGGGGGGTPVLSGERRWDTKAYRGRLRLLSIITKKCIYAHSFSSWRKAVLYSTVIRIYTCA